jgi:hypothetical protein
MSEAFCKLEEIRVSVYKLADDVNSIDPAVAKAA